MAAGLGFKTFSSGDILTASDVNGYLMQGVWVFANAAARTAAVTSPQEGNVSYLSDTNSLEIYSGSAWVAYGSGDITEVQAGTGISVASGTGPVPVVTNTVATAFDAKGDLVAGTGADTFSKITVGANNTVLMADSTTATGLKWATVSSNPQAFWAYKAGPDQSLTSGTYTKVTFANETLDSNSWYDTSNSRFTPQTAGYYWITGSVRFENTSTTTELRLMIYKNGSAVNIQTTLGSGGTIWNGIQISSLVYFNGSTDYVELYASQTSGSNKVIFYTQNEAWFQGFFVRS